MINNNSIVLISQFTRYAKTIAHSKRYHLNYSIGSESVLIHGIGQVILWSDRIEIHGNVRQLSAISRIKWMPEEICDQNNKNDNYGVVKLFYSDSSSDVLDIGQATFPLLQYIKWFLQYGNRTNQSLKPSP